MISIAKAVLVRPGFPRPLLAVLGLLLCLHCSPAVAGLKIYYLRHAEGGHNVVKEWSKVPRAERPAYVGNPNVFTPKGEKQVTAATEKLQRYRFDFIAVSSMWRTRHTIMPYLKATGAKGEIWPELHEFGGGSRILSTNLPAAAVEDVLNAGPRVELPADEADFFRLRDDGKHDFKLPAGNGKDHEAAVQLVVRSAAERIRKHFGGSEKMILLVGHGTAGKALLRALTNNPLEDSPSMVNTGLWMVEEQPGGKFKLELYNDAPYPPKKKSDTPAKSK